MGDVISFSGSATDAQQETLPASSLSWELVQQHCPADCHSHPVRTWSGVASGSFNAPDHEYPSYLKLRLSATDAGGLTATETLRLDPRTVELSFQSSPSGLQLTIGSSSMALTKIGALSGSNATWTLCVDNSGPGAAQNVVVTARCCLAFRSSLPPRMHVQRLDTHRALRSRLTGAECVGVIHDHDLDLRERRRMDHQHRARLELDA